jgi:energy-coupling factor transporter ATP-binding protein EcfA2
LKADSSLPVEAELTPESRQEWIKLQQLAPLNTGPRMLYALVDAPLLRRRLAEVLDASLQEQKLPVAWLDFPEPYYQPLQEIFDQAAQHPDARFFFLFGLERSLLSAEHRMSALTDLNFHRDQISKRLPGPLVFWIPDATFTDLLINAPDFTAWRGGVFKLRDEASEREGPYRQHFIDQFGKLTLYSATADAPLAVDLEQVFVKLTAIQQRQPTQALFRAIFGTTGTELSSSMEEAAKEKTERFIVREEITRVENFTTTLSISAALEKNQCLAVIGAPGSGKTTLLKYLALSFARRQARERLELAEDRLPIIVYLRDFGPFLDTLSQQEDGASLLLRFLAEQYQKTAAYLNLPEDFFSQQLAAGRCIVLLDGLDELVDPAKRSLVLDMIVALASRYSGNRFVVTSRPRGYESDAKQRLASLYAECTIRDFDDADMNAFARSWYTAVTIDRRGDTVAAREVATTQAEDLLRAIRADERIKALAHNPLLLSVLAMVHQRGVGLPQQRAEMYDECTDMLLGYWDQTKGGEAARVLVNLGFLNRTEKRALLEPVALWFHERGEHGLEAKKEELEEQIAAQFGTIFGDKPEKARERAVLFLRVIDERAGLLVERAPGVYAFAHLTFQEYLAARAIADREDYIDYTLKRLHKPWWREVLLLEVGHLSDQRYFGRRTRKLTSDLLVAIRKAGSWLEDVLKRDLLFAARCLCDTGPLGVDDQVRQTLMDELIALWESTPYEPQRRQVEGIFAYAMPTVNGERVRTGLLALVQDRDDDMCVEAAVVLVRLSSAAATPLAMERLVALSADTDASVRQAAAVALGGLSSAAATPLVVERLVALSADTDASVRQTAAVALGGLGSAAATPLVMERLVALSADADDTVRWAAAVALGGLGSAAATPLVMERLVALSADADASVRLTAAVGLGRVGVPSSTFTTLVDFWLPQLSERDYQVIGSKHERICNVAYEQLQHLAELREQRVATDKSTLRSGFRLSPE